MTRAGHALLTVVGGACLTLGCSGSTPRDQNFGTDAESGFEVPPVSTDAGGDGALAGTTGTVTGAGGDTGALTGTAGDTGALTVTPGGAGAGGGAGTSSDSGADVASDGAAP